MKLVGAAVISLAILIAAVTFPQLQVVFETVPLNTHQIFSALALSIAVPIMGGFFK